MPGECTAFCNAPIFTIGMIRCELLWLPQVTALKAKVAVKKSAAEAKKPAEKEKKPALEKVS